MTRERHQRIATWIGCAIPAAYFGWHLVKHTPDALEALAIFFGV